MPKIAIGFANRSLDDQAHDWALLRRYVDLGSQDAFKELVVRHIGWINGMCRKALRDPHQAEDVAQSVFVILARRAAGITEQVRVSGWLFNTTRFAIKDARKQSARYRKREDLARSMELERQRPVEKEIDPAMQARLDESMARLGEKDRLALLMHFYEGLSLSEMASALGIGKEGAKKRVSRALARLREKLGGKTSGATILAISFLLQQNAAEAAPFGLAGGAVSAALSPIGAATAAQLIALRVLQTTSNATRRLLQAALGLELLIGVVLLSGVMNPSGGGGGQTRVISARTSPIIASQTKSVSMFITGEPKLAPVAGAMMENAGGNYRSGAFDPEETAIAPPEKSKEIAAVKTVAKSGDTPARISNNTSPGGKVFAGIAPFNRNVEPTSPIKTPTSAKVVNATNIAAFRPAAGRSETFKSSPRESLPPVANSRAIETQLEKVCDEAMRPAPPCRTVDVAGLPAGVEMPLPAQLAHVFSIDDDERERLIPRRRGGRMFAMHAGWDFQRAMDGFEPPLWMVGMDSPKWHGMRPPRHGNRHEMPDGFVAGLAGFRTNADCPMLAQSSSLAGFSAQAVPEPSMILGAPLLLMLLARRRPINLK